MFEPTILQLARPCPLPPIPGDGAMACFLEQGGSLLQIQFTGLRAIEVQALNRGLIKAGILARGGAILLLFQFYGPNGPLMVFACPFDIRKVPPELRDIPTCEPGERLAIGICGVDEANIVRALRAITLPESVTAAFLKAVAEQVDSPDSGQAAHAAWGRYEPVELAQKHCVMELCGK